MNQWEQSINKLEQHMPKSLYEDIQILLQEISQIVDVSFSSLWLCSQNMARLQCYQLLTSDGNTLSNNLCISSKMAPGFFQEMEETSFLEISSEESTHPFRTILESSLHHHVSTIFVHILRRRGVILGVIASSKKTTCHPLNWTKEEKLTVGYIGKLATLSFWHHHQKEVKRQLIQKERRLETLTKNMSDLITEVSLDLRILQTTPSSSDMLGYPPEERLGRSIFEFVHPKDQQSLKDTLQRILLEGAEITNTYRVLNSSGEYVYLESIGRRNIESSGKVVSIIFTSRNVTERVLVNQKLNKSYLEAKKNIYGFINTLGSIVEARDPYTAGHQQNVASLAKAIGKKMGLKQKELEGLELAALVHDIGKIYIPTEILCKPGKIMPIEYKMIQEHACHGKKLLESVSSTWPLATIVSQHHERIDGSGYPLGLANKDLLIESKIVAVADVFDAMASHRPYRPALGTEKALEELISKANIIYDKEVVDALVSVVTKDCITIEQDDLSMIKPLSTAVSYG